MWNIPPRIFHNFQSGQNRCNNSDGSFHHVLRGNLCRRLLELISRFEAQRAVAVVLSGRKRSRKLGERAAPRAYWVGEARCRDQQLEGVGGDSRCCWLTQFGELFHYIDRAPMDPDWPFGLPPMVAVFQLPRGKGCPTTSQFLRGKVGQEGQERARRPPTRTWCEVTRESLLAASSCLITTRTPVLGHENSTKNPRLFFPTSSLACTFPSCRPRSSLCFATCAPGLVLLAVMVFDLEPCFIFLLFNAKRVTYWSTAA